MPLSLCMLAYHLYTLSKPVSPNSMFPVVNGLQRYYNFRATQALLSHFHQNTIKFYLILLNISLSWVVSNL